MTGILSAFFGGNYGAKPNAPTVGTATVTGTTTATLTFTAPAFNGGVTITSYTATSSPGGITSTLNQSGSGTFSITGLTAGTTYTFSVTATNAVGTSASSGASNSITTYSVPANTVAPVVSGTATFGQTLTTTNGTWTGVPTPTYTYQWQRAGSNISGATGSTYQLVSADVGNAIRCVVTATNTAGSSSANSNATAAVSAAVPGAPQSVSATATGSSTATVSWSAPASNGGATITSYSIYWSGGSTSTATTSVGVTGLSAATAYTFTVYATNSAGTGSGTASNSITTDAARGCAYYTTPGLYGWVVPAGLTSMSVVVVAPGGSRGMGGGSAWASNVSVTPGSTLYLKVGAGSTSSFSISSQTTSFNGETQQVCYNSINSGVVGLYAAANCSYPSSYGTVISRGSYSSSGVGYSPCYNYGGYAGGGAAGFGGNLPAPYAGCFNSSGGYGGYNANSCTNNPHGNGLYGGGGGGGPIGAGVYCTSRQWYWYGGTGGGGGMSIYGNYSSGTLGSNPRGGGSAGYGGTAGGSGTLTCYYQGGGAGGAGGFPGGKGGQGGLSFDYYCCPDNGRQFYPYNGGAYGTGGNGAVRIIYPGSSRRFPNTDAAP